MSRKFHPLARDTAASIIDIGVTMFLFNGRRERYRVLVFLVLLSLALTVTGCSSGGGVTKQPTGSKTNVIFSEWSTSERGVGFKSTVSAAALGDDKKRVLFEQEGQLDGLRLSLNGKKIAYLIGYEKLFISNINGSGRYMVDSSTLGWPSWSADGKQLAYVHRNESTNKSTVTIYSVKDRKKNTIELGKYGSLACSVQGWYPDGKSVAIFANGVGERSWILLSVNTGTGKAKEVAKEALLSGLGPDGSLHLVRAVISEKTEDIDPYKSKVKWEVWQGKNDDLKQVIKDQLPSNLVSWSDDGTKVAYSKIDEKYGTQLFIASSNGKDEKRITELRNYGQFIPVWAPDGESVVFSAIKLEGKDPGTYLYFYDVNTGKTSLVIKGDRKPMQLGSIFAVYK